MREERGWAQPARDRPSLSSGSPRQGPPWGQQPWGAGEGGQDPSKGAAGLFWLQSLRWGLEGKSKAPSWGLGSGPFPSRVAGPRSTAGSAAAAALQRGESSSAALPGPALRPRVIQRHQVPPMLHGTLVPIVPRLLRPPLPCPAHVARLWLAALPALGSGSGSGASEPSRGQGTGVGTLQTLARGSRSTATLPGAPSPPAAAGDPRHRDGANPTRSRAGVCPCAPRPQLPRDWQNPQSPGPWTGAMSPWQQWPDNSGKWPKMWV